MFPSAKFAGIFNFGIKKLAGILAWFVGHSLDSPSMMENVAKRHHLSKHFPTNRNQGSNVKPAAGVGVLPARLLLITSLITDGTRQVTPKQIRNSFYGAGRDIWV
jgi:hypothetical protein